MNRKSGEIPLGSRASEPLRGKTVLVIVGPTATGKSEVAFEIARNRNAEIVSADSMQIYRDMDIGTAKPEPEIRKIVPHHLIDIADFKQPFSAALYQKKARGAIDDILKRDKLPILVGGTGLYVRAAIDDFKFPEGNIEARIRNDLEEELSQKGIDDLYNELIKIDPEAADFIDKNNGRRIIRALEVYRLTGKPFSDFRKQGEKPKSIYPVVIAGLKLDREVLYDRINRRVKTMIEKGLIEETQRLIESSYREAIVSGQAIGYKELIDYIDGKDPLSEAVEKIKTRTRHYAKRQITWFNKDPRIVWFNAENPRRTVKEIELLIEAAVPCN